IAMYFAANVYGSFRWGASMPIGLLSYGLLITLAGIAVGRRAGLAATFASCAALIIFGIREHALGLLPPWKQGVINTEDALSYAAIVALAGVFAWFSALEIDRSLERALHSEAALRKERDNLETMIQVRTRAWKKAELAHSVELARFAEFGKLAAG